MEQKDLIVLLFGRQKQIWLMAVLDGVIGIAVLWAAGRQDTIPGFVIPSTLLAYAFLIWVLLVWRTRQQSLLDKTALACQSLDQISFFELVRALHGYSFKRPVAFSAETHPQLVEKGQIIEQACWKGEMTGRLVVWMENIVLVWTALLFSLALFYEYEWVWAVCLTGLGAGIIFAAWLVHLLFQAFKTSYIPPINNSLLIWRWIFAHSWTNSDGQDS